jgi:fructose-1,6-bisphosphatase I
MHQEISEGTPALGPPLAQFLREEQRQFPDISEAIPRILHAIVSAGKTVDSVVRKLDLAGIIGSQGSYNLSGDEQQNLDMLAHRYFVHALAATEEVCGVISEEAVGIIAIANSRGNYVVALDPLDGSPNIDVNAAIGTIFSVYQRRSSQTMPVQQDDVLQAGNRQLAAGYILYGTSTMLVYTACHGVHGFTYDPSMGQFFLAHQAMQMPKTGQSYAINDGYFDAFPSYVQHYIQQCRRNGYAARYMGALVADFHRHLIKGGIYLYPSTPKNPAGKLRLMLECNALALIAKQAGGAASNGQQAILAIQPEAIHQRVPLYIGSTSMVQNLLGE